MKADTLTLTKVFYRPVKYQIPLFQRPYVWTEELQWQPLWDDIRTLVNRQLDTSETNDDIAHFIGAIVLEQVPGQTGYLESRSVIDGQQRLTTLQLLIAAARSIAIEQGAAHAAELLGELIFNDPKLYATESDRFKVRPTEFDRAAFEAAIGGKALTGNHEGQRITHAYEFFRRSIDEWVREDGSEPPVLLEALNKAAWQLVECVVIDLDREDNAQVIFETLNARGTPLLAADLVKNLLFQPSSANKPVREDIYELYWKPLDGEHWRRDIRQGRLVRPRIDVFIMHWLTMTLRREVVIHQLYPDFRSYLKSHGGGSDAVVSDLAASAAVYDRFETYTHRSPEGQFFYRLGEMDTTTALPLLLWMFGPDGLGVEERTIAIRAIESWLVRRMVTRQTAKNYNNLFLTLLNRLAEGPRTGTAVVEYFRGLEGDAAEWPSDEKFLDHLRTSPLYTSLVRRRLRMLLEAIEESLGTDLTEHVSHSELTVEHVLPQQWQEHWPLATGDDADAQAARRDYLKHTLGNLTLITGKLNSTASNSAWVEKRDYLNKHSVLLISSDVRMADSWGEEDIEGRTRRLSEIAAELWPGPNAAEWNVRALQSADELPAPAHDFLESRSPEAEPSKMPEGASTGGGDDIPGEIMALIERRATQRPDLPAAFARMAISRPDVQLRLQASKNEPMYFQVRSNRHPYAVAYTNVFASEIKIDYRLPDTHETYGKAKPRSGNAYGVGLVVPDQGYLDIAARLLDDALAQAPSASSSRPEVWDEQSWFEDLASRGHGDFSSAAREILEWAESNDVSAHYRASGKVGGIDFLPPTDQAAWLFSMWTNGVLIAENNHLKKAAAFATQDSRRELLRRLNEIPGVSLNSDNPDGYQRFPLTAVAANLASFLDVYRWVLDELTRSSAESAVSQPHG